MNYPELADRVAVYKKGDDEMSNYFEQIRAESREEGKEETIKSVISNMLTNNFDMETISRCTGLSEQEILALLAENRKAS